MSGTCGLQANKNEKVCMRAYGTQTRYTILAKGEGGRGVASEVRGYMRVFFMRFAVSLKYPEIPIGFCRYRWAAYKES